MADEREKIVIDIDVDERSVSSLTQEMDRLKDAMTRTTDEKTFQKLAKEAGALKYEIERGEEAINEFAKSQDGLTGVSAAFGSIGSSLMSLDFDRALDGANRLQSISSNISFGDAIGSLRKLGQTFATIGKTLLTNPIFLIAGVIAAIGYAVYKLMEELGLLQPILDAVGALFDWLMIPIKALIQGLKDLTDWFGWTDNAGEELAENTIENNKKVMESNKKKTEALVSSYDHEIAKMKARGEDASKLERKRLEEIQETRKEEVLLAMESAESIAKLKGKDSDEYKAQMEAIEEIQKAFKQGRREIELFDIKQAEANKKRIEKEQEEEKALREKSIEAWKAMQEEKKAREEETAAAQRAIELKLEEFKITQIENDIEREKQLAIFREERNFEQIDRALLTNEQIEQLEQNHLARLEAIKNEATQKEIEAENKKRDALKQARLDWIANNIEEDEESPEEKAEREHEEAIEQLTNLLESEAITEQEFRDLKLQREQQLAEELKRIDDDRSEAIKANRIAEMALEQAKADNAMSLAGDMLSNIAEMAGEGTALAKGAAVAQATMDTYKAAVAAYAAGSSVGGPAGLILGPVAAGLAIAAGLVNVKKILSTPKPKGAKGGGGGGGSVPSVSTPSSVDPTPVINMYGNESESGGGSEQFESVDRNQGNNNEVRAYVRWSDIEETESNNSKVQNQMAL